MNLIFLLYVTMPILAGITIWWFAWKHDVDLNWFGKGATHGQTMTVGIIVAIAIAIMIGLFYLAVGTSTLDTEVRSGVITEKIRDTNTWLDSYDCEPCVTQKDGRRTCATCHERKYSVLWRCKSTIGERQIERRVSTNPFTLHAPDPQEYTNIKIGDPVASTFSYVNYLQTVPDTLFDHVDSATKARYKNLLPEYPDKERPRWTIDRVIPVGLLLPNLADWNLQLAKLNSEVGPKKQANVIIVPTNITDPKFATVLRNHWEGVNKNDVVVVIGTNDGTTFSWVKVISWTKREDFKKDLETELMRLNQFDATRLMQTIHGQVMSKYERREMKEFADVFKYAVPPMWYTVCIMLLLIGGTFAGVFVILKRKM